MSEEQQPRPDETASGASGGDAALPPELSELLGSSATALMALAARARETLAIGLESVSGQAVSPGDVTWSGETLEAIQHEIGASPHMGFELHVALSPTEATLAAAFVSLDDLGAVLSIETGAEQMADEEFAAAQGETVAQGARELLDLLSITLFSDQLAGIEVTLAGHYVAQPETALALVADVSPGAVPLRLDIPLTLPSGSTARLMLVMPSSLVQQLGARLAPVEGGAAPADPADTESPYPADELDDDGGLDELFDDVSDGPTPFRREAPAASDAGESGADGGFGLDSDPGNVSPFRPAGTFGAATGDDVDVHPVRFPPLPEQEPSTPGKMPAHFDLIMDVAMRVTVELGRSSMTVDEVLSLGPGSVVELNKLAGEPVDVLVNDRLIARGEVVVVDENFGVRVTEIVSPRRRVHAMGAS